MIGNTDDDFVSPSNGSPIQMVCKWPHRASINDDPPTSEMISLHLEIHKIKHLYENAKQVFVVFIIFFLTFPFCLYAFFVFLPGDVTLETSYICK